MTESIAAPALPAVAVCGQDPDAVAAATAVLAGIALPIAVPIGADGDVTIPAGMSAGLLVLTAAVPADPVDRCAAARLRAGLPALLPVAAGFGACGHAGAVALESAHRLGVPAVLPLDRDTLRRALTTLPPPAEAAIRVAARSASGAVPAGSRGDPTRGERAAYLRAALARARADLLAEASLRHRRVAEAAADGSVATVTAGLRAASRDCRAATENAILAINRGAFAGRDAPSPAVDPWPQPPVTGPGPGPPRPEDLLLPVLGASAALGVARAAPPGWVGGWSTLLAALAGICGALWLLRIRRRAAGRARWRAWVQESAAVARGRVDQRIAAALVVAEARAGVALARPIPARGPRKSPSPVGTDRPPGASE